MKKTSIFFLSTTLLASIAFADDDRIIATYKGGEVKESEVIQQFQPVLAAQTGGKDKKFTDLDSALQETLVRAYINIKLLEEEAKDSGIESSKQFQDKLNAVKNQMIQQELMERFVKSYVTDKMVDEEYNKLVANLKGKNEIKVSHILVATEKEAKNAKNRLNKGEKFAKLAKELSKDEGSKANGGELGYIVPGQLVPEFEEKAMAMKVNDISAPVKTQFGWHIITVLDKRPAQIPTKEEAVASIKNKLSREAIEKHFAELSSKADIKIMLPSSAPQVSDESKKGPTN